MPNRISGSRWASFEWEKRSSRKSPAIFSADSMEIIPYIVPSVLLGIPLGSYLIRWMDPGTFRRACMAFDALVVAFGLSRVLIDLNLATAFTTYSILTIMMMLNAYLLFRFFRDRTVP